MDESASNCQTKVLIKILKHYYSTVVRYSVGLLMVKKYVGYFYFRESKRIPYRKLGKKKK